MLEVRHGRWWEAYGNGGTDRIRRQVSEIAMFLHHCTAQRDQTQPCSNVAGLRLMGRVVSLSH